MPGRRGGDILLVIPQHRATFSPFFVAVTGLLDLLRQIHGQQAAAHLLWWRRVQDRPRIRHHRPNLRIEPAFLQRRLPGLAQRRAEQGDRLQLLRHCRRRELGIERRIGADRRRRERLLGELRADFAFVLVEDFEPGLVAVGRPPDQVRRAVVDARDRLQPDFQVLGVVAAPVEAGRATEPLVLAAAVELAFVRAQLEHGDLVRLDVGQQPFVCVQAVVAFPEDVHRLVDAVGVLQHLADAGSQGHAVDVEARLADGSLGDEQARVVHVVIQATLDAGGVALHQHAMALGRLHVEPDDFAVGRRRAGGGEGAAVIGLRLGHWPQIGIQKLDPLQPGRRCIEGTVECLDLGPAIEADDIDEIEWPAIELRAGGVGPIGDPLHFFEVFLLEPAHEKRVHQRPRVLPAFVGRLRALNGREAAQVAEDFRRQEPAVLVAALVRLALDVQHDPAGLWIAVCRAVPLHRFRIGAEVGRDGRSWDESEKRQNNQRNATHGGVLWRKGAPPIVTKGDRTRK